MKARSPSSIEIFFYAGINYSNTPDIWSCGLMIVSLGMNFIMFFIYSDDSIVYEYVIVPVDFLSIIPVIIYSSEHYL